jgi:hypothetical protein
MAIPIERCSVPRRCVFVSPSANAGQRSVAHRLSSRESAFRRAFHRKPFPLRKGSSHIRRAGFSQRKKNRHPTPSPPPRTPSISQCNSRTATALELATWSRKALTRLDGYRQSVRSINWPVSCSTSRLNCPRQWRCAKSIRPTRSIHAPSRSSGAESDSSVLARVQSSLQPVMAARLARRRTADHHALAQLLAAALGGHEGAPTHPPDTRRSQYSAHYHCE